jgi:hypothetical protein
MRKDINKVVKTGKRWPRKGKGRRPAQSRPPKAADREDAPPREPMARYSDNSDWGYAYFKARHNALVRFLRGRIGVPWGEVHSELCAAVRSDRLVRKYLDWYVGRKMVALHVRLVAGVPWAITPVRGDAPLDPGWLYVCPASGLLREWPGGGKAGRPRRTKRCT